MNRIISENLGICLRSSLRYCKIETPAEQLRYVARDKKRFPSGYPSHPRSFVPGGAGVCVSTLVRN